jgi:signal peptide peptidase SppA
MRLARILDLVYNKPWAITPESHKAIRDLLSHYMTQKAAAPFAFDQDDEDTDSPAYDVVGSTAIVPVEGVILNKCSGLEAMCGAFSLDSFKATLKELSANTNITSIILNISSGGGTVTGTPEAGQAIKALGKTKNVVAYTDSVAASAAYWLGCNAKSFFLSQSAEVGSIGVYSCFLDESQAFAQDGIKVEVFKGGNSQFKAMGLPGTSLTDEQKTYLQEGVDKCYQQFVSVVKANRKGVSPDALSGKMFDSTDAVKLGLVDGVINSLDSLIDYLNGN